MDDENAALDKLLRSRKTQRYLAELARRMGLEGRLRVFPRGFGHLGASPEAAHRVSHGVRVDLACENVDADPGDLSALCFALERHVEMEQANAEVSRHTLEKYRELTLLYRFGESLTHITRRQDLMDMSFRLLTSRVELDCFCAALLGEGPEVWELLRPAEQSFGGPEQGRFRFDALARLLADGHARILGDSAQHEPLWERAALSTAITIPMLDGEKLLGGLVFGRTGEGRQFSSEDQHLLTSFSFLFTGKLIDICQLERMLRNERMAAIGNMAGSIIHDIKNPLTSITAFAELLGDFDFPQAERKEYAGMIVEEVRRMVGMVEDLLEFTRGGRSRYDLAPLPLAPFLEDMARPMRRDMAERGILFEIAAEMDGAVLVDRDKFKRVLLNLAGNARDALASGGALRILAASADGMAHVRVQDNGPGIPEAIRERLFEPFVTHGKKGGTGLGTAISKKIVEEMGGRIWFETACGQGTTFHIRLPLAD